MYQPGEKESNQHIIHMEEGGALEILFKRRQQST